MFEMDKSRDCELAALEIQRLSRNLDETLARNMVLVEALTLIRDHGEGDYPSISLADAVLSGNEISQARADFWESVKFLREGKEHERRLRQDGKWID